MEKKLFLKLPQTTFVNLLPYILIIFIKTAAQSELEEMNIVSILYRVDSEIYMCCKCMRSLFKEFIYGTIKGICFNKRDCNFTCCETS